MQPCEVHDLGQVEFNSAWQLQNKLAADIATSNRPPALLLLEHPHTYTFGRRGQSGNLLWNERELSERGVQVHWIDRGGDVTYHGPGQLVGYPLLRLTDGPAAVTVREGGGQPRIPQVDYLGYLRRLEEVLIQTLAGFGLVSGQRPGLTGVWVQADVHSRCRRCPPEMRRQPAKIGAIGVKVDAQGVTRHGFALNVTPEMAYWDGIVGCGLEDHPVTSMEELMRRPPSMAEVKQAVARAFGRVFDFEMQYT